jgi:hypothetical protein
MTRFDPLSGGYIRSRGATSEPVGVGTALLAVLEETGVVGKADCNCAELQAEMDSAGIDGCRERKAEFVARLKENASKYGLREWAAAGWLALWQGKPLSIEGLYDLAIERAG